MLLKIFCVTQVILAFAMVVVDHFHTNFAVPLMMVQVLIPLGLSLYYLPGPLPFWAVLLCVVFYLVWAQSLLRLFLRNAPLYVQLKDRFAFYYSSKRAFLPAEWEEEVRNVLYVSVFLLVWACMILSLALLFSR